MDKTTFKPLAQFLLAFFIFVSKCIIEKESFVHDNGSGQMGEIMVAQPQLGSDPAQTFLCGYAVKQMRWSKLLYNCNCGYKFESVTSVAYQCEWCQNYFWTMNSGFKAIYCKINNWSSQTTKVYDTGNKFSRNWREFKCPKDTFVSKASIRLGQKAETDIGFVGIDLVCSSLQMKESFTIQDSNRCSSMETSANSYGTFVSGVQVVSIKGGQITGLKLIFEGVPMISNVVVRYKEVGILNTTEKVIESAVVSNMGLQRSNVKVNFTKSYSITNTWSIPLPYIGGYKIHENVSVQAPQSRLNKADIFPYQMSTQPFGLDKQILTRMDPVSPIMMVVPRYTNTTVSTNLKESRAKSVFEATVTFIDKLNGQIIVEKVITGTWYGVILSSVYVGFEESQCVGAWSSSNLVQNGNFQNNLCNSTWCLWGEKNYTSSHLPGWIPNPEIQMSKGQNYNKVLGSNWAIQLDVNQNSCIKQFITLKAGKYLMNIDWAARSGFTLSTNGIELKVNGAIIKKIPATDYNFHNENIEFTLKESRDDGFIEICGTGASQGVGAAVNGVRLFSYLECASLITLKY